MPKRKNSKAGKASKASDKKSFRKYEKNKIDMRKHFEIVGLDEDGIGMQLFDQNPADLEKAYRKEVEKDPNSLMAVVLEWRLGALESVQSFEKLLDRNVKLAAYFDNPSTNQDLLTAMTLLCTTGIFALCADRLEKALSEKEEEAISDAEEEDDEDDEDEDEGDDEEDDGESSSSEDYKQ